MENTLYYGDNLDILREHIKDETIDLIYLDPPFNSNKDYNVLFSEKNGTQSPAQMKAFEDTWHWDRYTEETYREIVENLPKKVADLIKALRSFLGENDMMAYLIMMTIRLQELHRVIKSTGSIYLHCDPTASHYLKLVMDAVFSPICYRNEIVWRRSGTHGKSIRYAPIHDVILFYSKTNSYKWNYPKKPYMKGHVEGYFIQDKKGWRTNYYGNVLTGSGIRYGESGKPWKGFDPTAKGRHWAIPKALYEDLDEDFSGFSPHQKMDRLYELGLIEIIPDQAWPIYKRYLTPQDGQAIPDIWAYQPYTQGTVFGTDKGIDEDIRWLSPQDKERLGYPTQKPEALLERIIKASSKRGDIVLDPFCGCGTTIIMAEKLNRKWIGIDITHLAISLMKNRLENTFSNEIKYQVIGEPTDLNGAEELAKEDPYQFQWWSLGLVGARPAESEKKKGADKGIDGCIYFHDEPKMIKTKAIMIQVKCGHIDRGMIDALKGVLVREKAHIGVFITLQKPTRPMQKEALSAGFYESPLGKHYPKIQILTIGDLISGNKNIERPPKIAINDITLKKAKRYIYKGEQGKLL